eukprot:538259_1
MSTSSSSTSDVSIRRPNSRNKSCIEKNTFECIFWIFFCVILVSTGIYVILSIIPKIEQDQQWVDNKCYLTNRTIIPCINIDNCTCTHQNYSWIYIAIMDSKCSANTTLLSSKECNHYQLNKYVICDVTDCQTHRFEFINLNGDTSDHILKLIGGCLIILCGICTYPCIYYLERKPRNKNRFSRIPMTSRSMSSHSMSSQRRRGSPRKNISTIELPVLEEIEEES